MEERMWNLRLQYLVSVSQWPPPPWSAVVQTTLGLGDYSDLLLSPRWPRSENEVEVLAKPNEHVLSLKKITLPQTIKNMATEFSKH